MNEVTYTGSCTSYTSMLPCTKHKQVKEGFRRTAGVTKLTEEQAKSNEAKTPSRSHSSQHNVNHALVAHGHRRGHRHGHRGEKPPKPPVRKHHHAHHHGKHGIRNLRQKQKDSPISYAHNSKSKGPRRQHTQSSNQQGHLQAEHGSLRTIPHFQSLGGHKGKPLAHSQEHPVRTYMRMQQ